MARIEKVLPLLKEKELDALVVSYGIDLYYLTQLKLSLGYLVIERTKATLFVDGRYQEAARKKALCEVQDLDSYKKWASSFSGRVGFDAEVTSYQAYSELATHLKERAVPLHAPIKRLRQIKEEKEVAFLREAGELGSRGFDFVVSQLKEGMREDDLARALEIFWLQEGGEGVSFDPIIAFGANTSQPHYRAGATRLKQGDPVLIDIGVIKHGYASDMTRVVFFGQPSEQMQAVYHVVKEAQIAAIARAKPGVLLKELDLTARKVIEDAGFGEYFPHGLGHGVGLEVHELPLVRKTVEEAVEAGMVLTIEPGVYLPGIGGVRLEDTLLITPTSNESLTKRALLDMMPIK